METGVNFGGVIAQGEQNIKKPFSIIDTSIRKRI
jgi:hypothetical protein